MVYAIWRLIIRSDKLNKKEQVKELLKDYPFMVSNVVTEIKPPVAENVKSINKNLLPALENWDIDFSDVDEKVIENIENIQIVEGVINLILDDMETKFVKEHFFQNKSLRQLTDGRYGVYTEKSMQRLNAKVIDKLIRANILKNIDVG